MRVGQHLKLLSAAFLIATTAQGSAPNNPLEFELTVDHADVYSDAKGRTIVVLKKDRTLADGQRITIMGENVFFRHSNKFVQAETSNYQSAGDRSRNYSERFSLPGGGKIDTSSVASSLILDCLKGGSFSIPRLSPKDAAKLLAESKFSVRGEYELQQLYRFPDARLLAVDGPAKNSRPEAYRYWIGRPGSMKLLDSYPNTSDGMTKVFRASEGVSDGSIFNDASAPRREAGWLDQTTGKVTDLERLAEAKSRPKLSELAIPRLGESGVPADPCIQYAEKDEPIRREIPGIIPKDLRLLSPGDRKHTSGF